MQDAAFFQNWALDIRRNRPDLQISGSPNRTLARSVLEDVSGKLYLLEQYDLRKKSAQTAQNRILQFLQTRQLPGIHPALQTQDGGHGITHDRSFWQLRPWVEADPLPRQTLGSDSRIAGIWSDILLKLKEISLDPAMPPTAGERFTFTGYIRKLLPFTERRMPDLAGDLKEILQFLNPFLERENTLPLMFAHGDFHPGNILLQNNAVSAVIDWEFLGWKCAGYDLALLLGCLGMDDPDWLDGKAVRTLQDNLFLQNYMPEPVWQDLPDLMAAIRLGWFGEWVDLGDHATAKQEIAYIRFLLGK